MSFDNNNNQLKVAGLVPLTTTDFPGQLSAVLFCQGCPWQCRYCHNPHLIPINSDSLIAPQIIDEFLNKRVGLLDAVVFSGGEPTMQAAPLESIMQKVYDMGYKIGLHTAGTYPNVLEKVLPFVSWIGMDIKAPFGKYQRVTQRPEKANKILESIKYILKSNIDYEFRTTIHSNLLSDQDIIELAYDLSELGVKKYVLQQFRPVGCADQELVEEYTSYKLQEPVLRQVSAMFSSFEYRV